MSLSLTESSKPTVRRVTVIGSGVMGRGIAIANASRGVSVTLSDTSTDALDNAVAQVAVCADPALVSGSQDFSELADADLIIEAVIERAPVKQRIFKKLEPLARDETIFASNTSSIPITQIAAKLARPERFIGLHFCHPVAERPLLEIVRGDATSDATIQFALDYARSIGKRPVIVRDSPGFVVNRLFTPYLNEALQLLTEGAAVEDIETAALQFGMPIGPLGAIDAIGVDVALRAGTTIYEAFPERIVPSDLLLALFQAGDLGQKTGRGFFDYANEKTLAPTAQRLIEERVENRCAFSLDELTARLFLPMLTEAVLALEAGLVEKRQDIDDALVYGIAFPEQVGGVFHWADALGPATIRQMLRPLQSLGPRYELPESFFQAERQTQRPAA